MKRNNRKVMALLSAAAIFAAFCITGCGQEKSADPAARSEASNAETTKAEPQKNVQGQTEKAPDTLEPAELTWLLRIPEQPDGQTVLDELNKILREKLNVTLTIQFIDPVAYPEKTKLKITSGEKFDIMFTSAGYGFYDYASKGAFIPLDGLFEQYAPRTYAQIPEGFWDATRVNGEIYAIPNYQIVARQPAINIRKELAEKYNLKVDAITSFEEMEPIFKILKEKETDKQFIFAPPGLNHMDTMTYLGLEGIGADGTPGCIEMDGTGLAVINQYESPAFIKLIHTFKKFEKEGYINKDLALIPDITELCKNGEVLCRAFDTFKPGVETELAARFGYESVFLTVTDPYVTTSSILGTLQAVSATSENPERAMMLLELVNTDPEIYNRIVYGLVDRHYTMAGENTIEKIADSGYNTNVPWMIGNTFNGFLLKGTSPDINEQTIKLNESSKVSRIMGFSFNPEPVKAELSQCATVIDKYLPGFQFGMYDDLEGTLDSFNQELRAAGMDAVMAEKQVQLDAWAAAR